jgi:hypothetical protein
VRIERQNKLAEAVATHLVQQKITEMGQEAWVKRATKANLTTDQFTEVEIWSATGPVKFQFMALTNEVLDALACLVGIEMPPVFMADQPKLKVIGFVTGVIGIVRTSRRPSLRILNAVKEE